MKIKKIICKIKGHSLRSAGSCPFTGASYDYCERCENMFQVNELKP